MNSKNLIWALLALIIVGGGIWAIRRPAEPIAAKTEAVTADAPAAAAEAPATSKVALAEDYTLESVTPKRRYKIGVSFPFMAIPFWRNEAFGILDEAKKIGVDVVWYSADGYENIEKQSQQLEDLITQKVDAIVLAATSARGTVPAVEHAIANNIVVVNHVSPTDSAKVSAIVVSDDRLIGTRQGEAMCRLLPQGGNVAMLSGPAAAEWAGNRAGGFRDAIQKGCPNLKVVAERFTNPGRPEAQRETEDLLVAFQKLDGLFTVGDAMAMGAADAARAAKRKNMVITTAGFFEETRPYIDSGAIAVAIDESAVLNGRLALVRAVQVLNGEHPPRLTLVPTPVRTKESIASLATADIWAPSAWRIN